MPNDWLNVPHFKQEFNYSCVAACVRMALAFHGQDASEEDVRQILNTTPAGTRASNVSRVASLGFDVQFGTSNLPQLQTSLAGNAPPLVFLRTGPLDYWRVNDAHAVVVVGIDVTNVFLNDPFFEISPQQTSLVSFREAWAMTGHLAAVIRQRR